MDTQIYKNFIIAAKEQNITRAAEILHISQSTLSKQIKNLEDNVGKKLFIRDYFSVRLTDEGIKFLDILERISLFTDEALSDFTDKKLDVSGLIVFDVPESVQVRTLAKLIQHFKVKYPGMKYYITSSEHARKMKNLDEGATDFAIIFAEPDSQKYDFIKLPKTEELIFITTQQNALSDKEVIEPEDLKGEPIFANSLMWNTHIKQWAGEHFNQYALEGVLLLPYNLYSFVKEGLGSMITPDSHAYFDDGELTVKHFSPPIYFDAFIIWRKQENMSRVAQLFASFLKNNL